MAHHNCPYCEKVFTKRYSLIRHMVNVHKLEQKISRRAIQCPFPSCEEKFPYHAKLRNHLRTEHEITLVDQTLHFKTSEDFLAWKITQEKECHAKFIKACGKQHTIDGNKISRFNCNRTGVYTPEGRGLRRLKTQGSLKMGASCPATITASEDLNGMVTVNFCMTHVGHEPSKRHSNVKPSENGRNGEANGTLVVEGDSLIFAFTNEARKILDHYNITDQERKTLTEAFLTTCEPTQSNDEAMLDAIYKLADPKMSAASKKLSTEMQEIECSPCSQNRDAQVSSEIFSLDVVGEENPVLLYQPQCDAGGEGEVAKDFVLIVMNQLQVQLLKKFGHLGTIYLDTVHGRGETDQTCMCLFVLDGQGKCFLCALCLCPNIDSNILVTFFDKVHGRAGRVQPKVFMSDGDDRVLQSWVSVMGNCDQWLHTLWHTDGVWRRHLPQLLRSRTTCELDDSATCAAIYWHLCRLLKCDSKLKFLQIRSMLLSCMAKSKNHAAVSFFEKALWQKLDNWAWCFRSVTLRNLAVQLEAMHGAITTLFSSRQDRLHQSVFTLYQYFRTRSFGYMGDAALRTMTLASTNEQHRLGEILLGWTEGVMLSQVGDEPLWIVEREGDGNQSSRYAVQGVGGTCGGIDCFARCEECTACIHAFQCSCMDSAVQWQLCKHIHLVGCHRHNLEDGVVDTTFEKEPAIVEDDVMESEPDTNLLHQDTLETISELCRTICGSARLVSSTSRLVEIRDALQAVTALANEVLEPVTISGELVQQVVERNDVADSVKLDDHDYYVLDISAKT